MCMGSVYLFTFSFFLVFHPSHPAHQSTEKCRPGLIRSSDSLDDCSCVEASYKSVITCINNTATVVRGGWIGNYSGEILGGTSIYLFTLSDKRDTPLPSDWSEVDQTLCGKLHRTGTLCGNCVDGYGPAMYSFQCVKCSASDSRINWLKYLVLEYLPLSVMFFVLIVFNLDATSGAGNAFIFFAQMITTVFDIFDNGVVPFEKITHHHTYTLRALYQVPYGIWNMEFFSVFAPPFCLSDKIGTYGIILTNYAVALYPILLIVTLSSIVWLYGKGYTIVVLFCRPIHKCLLKVQKKWQIRRSIVGVFATFIILSYTKMLSTSFNLIMPIALYDQNDRLIHRNIPVYNGNAHFTDPGFIVMYIVAIVTLLVYIIVLPCLLMTPSFVSYLHRRTGWEWLVRILPWGRMQEFLEGFHSCYVDGGGSSKRVDYRWFSGVYLVLRGVFFLAYSFASSTMLSYTLLTIVCFLTMFVIAWTRPFKVKHHNTLNVGVFCILGVLCCATSYSTYQSIMWYSVPPLLFWLEYLLVFLPLIIVITNIIKWLWIRYRRKRQTRNNLRPFVNERRSYVSDDVTDVSVVDLGEDDPSEFLKFTEKTGRLKKSKREVTWYITSSDTAGSCEKESSINNYGSFVLS